MRRIRLPRLRVRSRNRFVIVVIIIAIVLVLAAILAYMVLVDKPERQPVPPKRPPPPPPVQPFPERAPEKWAQVKKPDSPPVRKTGGRKGRKPRPETVGDSAISGTMRRLAARFNECARKYGGVDGSVVRVGFSISPDGGVNSPYSMSPHRKTPLGRCIANTLGGAQFGRSEFGRSDVRWSITLHP